MFILMLFTEHKMNIYEDSVHASLEWRWMQVINDRICMWKIPLMKVQVVGIFSEYIKG